MSQPAYFMTFLEGKSENLLNMVKYNHVITFPASLNVCKCIKSDSLNMTAV